MQSVKLSGCQVATGSQAGCNKGRPLGNNASPRWLMALHRYAHPTMLLLLTNPTINAQNWHHRIETAFHQN